MLRIIEIDDNLKEYKMYITNLHLNLYYVYGFMLVYGLELGGVISAKLDLLNWKNLERVIKYLLMLLISYPCYLNKKRICNHRDDLSLELV